MRCSKVALVAGFLALMLWGCTVRFFMGTTPSPAFGPWYDGTYTGMSDLPTPQLIVVDVSVSEGRIVAIRVRKHPAWKAPQEQERLLRAVLEAQTTDVYQPRHAGSEQDQLLRAIEDALNQARQGLSSAP